VSEVDVWLLDKVSAWEGTKAMFTAKIQQEEQIRSLRARTANGAFYLRRFV